MKLARKAERAKRLHPPTMQKFAWGHVRNDVFKIVCEHLSCDCYSTGKTVHHVKKPDEATLRRLAFWFEQAKHRFCKLEVYDTNRESGVKQTHITERFHTLEKFWVFGDMLHIVTREIGR